MEKFGTVLKHIENLLFPSICQGCGEVGTYLCDKCAGIFIQVRQLQQCHICKKRVFKGLVHKKCKKETSLDGVFITAEYSKFIENYIGDIKYEFYFAMIGDLVRVMVDALANNEVFLEVVKDSIITFVPLHSMRKRWRGFNQAEEIARRVAKNWSINCVKLVKRVRRTKSQVGLGRRKRLANLRDALKVLDSVKQVDDKGVIVIDDVMTSGATLEECAIVLKESGIQKVYGLVFARG